MYLTGSRRNTSARRYKKLKIGPNAVQACAPVDKRTTTTRGDRLRGYECNHPVRTTANSA